MLRILEEKGHIRHEQDGPRYVYLPTVGRDRAKKTALRHVLQTFFNGSAEQALSALLDESDSRLSDRELDRLAELIDRAPHGSVTMNIPELPLGWLPLADVVAKTTVILLAAAVASLVLRRASAALRHLVWTLALSSALVLPIASVALPKWQLSLVTIAASSQTSTAPVSIVDDNANSSLVAPPLKRDLTAARSLPADPSAGALAKAKPEATNHEQRCDSAPHPRVNLRA